MPEAADQRQFSDFKVHFTAVAEPRLVNSRRQGGRQANEDPLPRVDFSPCAVLPTFSQE